MSIVQPGKVKQVEVDLNVYRALPGKVEQVEVDLNVYGVLYLAK